MMLKYLNVKAFSTIAIVSSIVIWLILLLLNGIQPGFTLDAFKQLPTVFTIEGLLWAVFAKWGWRWRLLQGWLVPFPDLQGTWSGILRSSWINPETKHPEPPIPVQVVIRQTFLNIHCILLTSESKSKSCCACLDIDPETGEKYLTGTYINTPRVRIRDRSQMHEGTVRLQIVGMQKPILKGDYYTTRATKGDIQISFVSRELQEAFVQPRSNVLTGGKFGKAELTGRATEDSQVAMIKSHGIDDRQQR